MRTRLTLSATPGRPYKGFVVKTQAPVICPTILLGLHDGKLYFRIGKSVIVL